MATNWFPHDASAHNDQRVLLVREKYGWEGYGLFWAVLEAMYETADGKLDTDVLRALYLRFAVEKEWLLEFIRFCVSVNLFVEADGTIYSERLVQEKLRMIEKSDQARQAVSMRKDRRKRKSTATDVEQTNNGRSTPPHPTPQYPPTHERMAADAAAPATEVVDSMEAEYRAFLPLVSGVLGHVKKFTPEGLAKWRARRKQYLVLELEQAFANLRNEPDGWKLKNLAHKELTWWLKSNDYIRELQHCHLKKPKSAAVIIS